MNALVLGRLCHHGGRSNSSRSSTRCLLLSPLLVQCRPIGRRWMHSQFQPHHDAKTENIRNIGIIAHVDAGKTTTTERMLYHSGVTRHLGRVDDGDTITDFLPMERERGITIQSAAITFNWPLKENVVSAEDQKTVNLIDTPGHQDFRFEVDRCLPILDGAVCIIDAVKGVEAHTERVWRSAHQFRIPRILFVNKLDRDGASFKRSVLDVATRLNGWPLVCQLPWWEKDKFVGVFDVIDRVGLRWNSERGYFTRFGLEDLRRELPSDQQTILQEIEVARERLIDKLSEYDDILVEEYLEKSINLPSESIKASIRRVISDGEGSLVPIFAGASLRNIGVEPLLDAVAEYLPSPLDRPDQEVRLGQGTHPLGKLLEEKIDSKAKLGKTRHHNPPAAVASVFKVANDPRRGALAFVRVYYGALHKNATMWNASMHQIENATNVLQISADTVSDIPRLSTGHIGALTGLKAARTGDTLIAFTGNKTPHEELKHIQIRPADIPPAVAFLSIEPYSLNQSKELSAALEVLSREDPSLRFTYDDKTESYILSGMGKMHLEIAQHRLKETYKVDAIFGTIAVDYKECLLGPTSAHRVEYDRAVAGKAGKTACTALLEPIQASHRDSPLEPTTERDGNLIHIIVRDGGKTQGGRDGGKEVWDREAMRNQLYNGVVSALARGPRRGSPLHDTRITITYDRATDFFGPATGAHVVNAANRAVREALVEANDAGLVAVMEPVMRVTVTCPEKVAGDVQHDITSGQGGQVLEVNEKNGGAAAAAASGDGGIDLSHVYAPPDPYDSMRSLQGVGDLSRTLEIVARVPLRKMLDYDSHLRGKTSGRHSLTMELDTFEKVVAAREKEI